MPQLKQTTVDGVTLRLFKTGKGMDASYRIEKNGRVVARPDFKEAAFDRFFAEEDKLEGRDTGTPDSVGDVVSSLNPF